METLGFLVESTQQVLIEQPAQVPVLQPTEIKVQIEVNERTTVVEQTGPTLVVVKENTPALVVEVGETLVVLVPNQGPVGPQGVKGDKGDPGEASVGGIPVELTNPQPGEVMALASGLKWINEDILDGGNF